MSIAIQRTVPTVVLPDRFEDLFNMFRHREISGYRLDLFPASGLDHASCLFQFVLPARADDDCPSCSSEGYRSRTTDAR